MSGSPDASSASATRASLIAGLRRGDMRAWYEMVDLYAPLVHHWCAQCRIGPDAADDVMQETFAAVARRIEQFEYRNQNDSFRGWLWTVTRNKVRDYRRNRLRQAESVGGSTAMRHLAEYPDEESLPQDEPTGPAEVGSLIRRGLEQVRADFEQRTWEAFWRTSVDGMPTDVVAAQLKMTAAGVRQARSRVLRRLRRQLGDRPD
jgi:RNA polymerase sigma-70 factor, ECF subfamily